jgi:RsiW-degrading membrane proteinase PrsW (M82 family)
VDIVNVAIDPFTDDLFFVLALIQSVLFVLLIRFLDLYEREPLSILALMAVWGAVGASMLAVFFNGVVSSIIYDLSPATEIVFGAAIYVPPVEETAKGAALVAAFALSYLAARRFGGLEFSGVTDGIVYGAAVGVGFAFAEDIAYFLYYAREWGLEEGLDTYLLRVFGTERAGIIGVWIGHVVWTAIFGAGLGLATWSRDWLLKGVCAFLGLGAATLMHAIHNGIYPLVFVFRFGLANTAAYWSGEPLPEDLIRRMNVAAERADSFLAAYDFALLVAFFLAIGLWLFYQRRVIRSELAEEVGTGLISREEWEAMPRYWRRSKWYWRVLWSGKVEQWCVLRRVHNELVDLAFLKWRTKRMGGDWGRVERLRRRIRNLKVQEIVELTSYAESKH